MLYGLVLVLHVLMCLVLIGIVLLQGGRGGLSDALGGAAAQSLFGGGAATVLTKITASCAALFMITSLSLAYLSSVRGRSVIEQMPVVSPEGLPAGLPLPVAPTQDVALQAPETSSQPTEQSPSQ